MTEISNIFQNSRYASNISYVTDFDAKGDGVTDDSVAIQEAIDSGAGRLMVPDGTFLASGLVLRDDLEMISQSPLAIIKLPDSTVDSIFTGVNVDNVKLTLNLDGNRANQATPGVAGLTALVHITGGTKVAVTNGHYFGSIDAGILIDDVDEVLVEGNFVNDITFHGIQVAGDCTNVIISNNHVKDITDGAGIIPMGNSTYVTVVGNIVEGVNGDSGDCITCYSDTNKYITIANNVCKDVEFGHGIHVGGEYVTVSGNIVDSPTNAGIFVNAQTIVSNHITVIGNTINDATTQANAFARDGIFINKVQNFTVSGNTVHNGQAIGVHLKEAAIGTVNGNSIRDSITNGIWSETEGERITYTGNTIKGTGSSGMLFDNEDQSVISDNIVEDYGTTDAGAFGLEITAGTLNKITGNYIRAGTSSLPAQPAGYSSAATNTMVKDNWFTDGSNQRIGAATAATTTTIPAEHDYISVSGTTTIDNIGDSTSYEGRIITLTFGASVTLRDGIGNLVLAGDFSATSDDILQLVLFNGSWAEISRSSN